MATATKSARHDTTGQNVPMRTSTRNLAVALLASLALLAAACGSEESTSTTGGGNDASTTTSTQPAATWADAYAEPGPYPVGITTLQLDSGPLVEVWYPAVEGSTGTDGYDLRDFIPEAVANLLTGDVPSNFDLEAARDAEVADEEFPLVLFSHGAAGVRVQSTFLTAHLASWGMVVAAPDHPSRDLASRLGGGPAEPTNSVDDLLGTLALMEAENGGGPFEGRIDLGKVAAVGHSAGGGTVLAAASDPALKGYVSMASGAFGAAEGEPLPDRPSFFLAGSTDAIVPPDTRTRPAFEAAPAPSLLWVIEGVGHNGFDDFCTFGGGTGIIGVAEASGLGDLLGAIPGLRDLGEDGCVPPSVPVAQTFPIINHAVTSWLRSLFGIDAEPVGLGPAVADAYSVPVVIEVKE